MRYTTHLLHYKGRLVTVALCALGLFLVQPHAAAAADVWTYATPGTYTWVAPAGVTKAYVQLIGAGGGGGNGQGPSQNSGCDCSTAKGGNAGKVVDLTEVPVVAGQSYTVVVGKGGQGGRPIYTSYCPWLSAGSNGGKSSFGSLTAAGGTGGNGAYLTPSSGPFSQPGGSNGTSYGKGGTGLACNNGGGSGTNGYVKVTTVSPPAITITGNGQNPVTVEPGTPIAITALFTPSPGDTVQRSYIQNSSGELWCGSGQTCQSGIRTESLESKTYTYTPTTNGSTSFYPFVRTGQYPESGYGVSLRVISQCRTNAVVRQGVCVCRTGYTDQNGACVLAPCTNNAVNPPTCNQCEPGYRYRSSTRVCEPLVTTCPDPNAIPPLCSSCADGYTHVGNACVRIPGATFTASRSTVRLNDPVTLTWNVTGAAPTEQCTISSDPAGVFSRQSGAIGATGTWQGSVETAPLASRTVFTLSCTNIAPMTVIVGINPSYIEI